ncbi:MAG: ParB N-terminal domain-containing protein [Burkholderiales bacterium]
MMANQKVQMIKTSILDFDPANPRFYRLNDSHSVDAVIEEMLDDESVQDLMLSIGQKGYFEGEPLLVVKGARGHFTVVEGNRRLAAVKLLNQEIPPPPRRKTSVDEIRAEALIKPPKELPCLIYTTRRQVLRYLGYRHITGIKEWDSLSKAKYLDELRNEFYLSMDETEQLRSLAKDIGSRSDYVGQLLTALSLYVRAESKKFFDLPISADTVEFSYITTALSYKSICTWLGLDSRNDIEMPNLNEQNLRKAFAWMFSKDQQGRTILGESRNLSEMAAVVASTEAVKVLEKTGRLAEAYLFTDGPESALNQALDLANERLRVVWNMLPSTKPLTPNHLDLADQVFTASKDIRAYLREKLED